MPNRKDTIDFGINTWTYQDYEDNDPHYLCKYLFCDDDKVSDIYEMFSYHYNAEDELVEEYLDFGSLAYIWRKNG